MSAPRPARNPFWALLIAAAAGFCISVIAYVAAGFTEGFFETGLSIWDVAAGSLLVTEAGGLVGNFTGEADFLEQRECLAATPRIYGQLVPILSKYSKFASAGDKAAVRQAVQNDTPASMAAVEAPEQAAQDAEGSEEAPRAPF